MDAEQRLLRDKQTLEMSEMVRRVFSLPELLHQFPTLRAAVLVSGGGDGEEEEGMGCSEDQCGKPGST
jgi:hypothetical protein